MKDALTSAEAVDYLDFNPEVGESGVTLLGLKPEQLQKNDAHKMVKMILPNSFQSYINFTQSVSISCSSFYIKGASARNYS